MDGDCKAPPVENGQEAVDKTLAGSYALILMDMHMPVMDGHAATRVLRDKGYTGLIVAVTASVMSADSGKAIKSGCDDYIAKPIGEDFEDKVEEMLEKFSMLSVDIAFKSMSCNASKNL